MYFPVFPFPDIISIFSPLFRRLLPTRNSPSVRSPSSSVVSCCRPEVWRFPHPYDTLFRILQKVQVFFLFDAAESPFVERLPPPPRAPDCSSYNPEPPLFWKRPPFRYSRWPFTFQPLQPPPLLRDRDRSLPTKSFRSHVPTTTPGASSLIKPFSPIPFSCEAPFTRILCDGRRIGVIVLF